jgi:hypothetical protein
MFATFTLHQVNEFFHTIYQEIGHHEQKKMRCLKYYISSIYSLTLLKNDTIFQFITINF